MKKELTKFEIIKSVPKKDLIVIIILTSLFMALFYFFVDSPIRKMGLYPESSTEFEHIVPIATYSVFFLIGFVLIGDIFLYTLYKNEIPKKDIFKVKFALIALIIFSLIALAILITKAFLFQGEGLFEKSFFAALIPIILNLYLLMGVAQKHKILSE